ncbi:unnamed protein product, partial [Durusdinium trenchii]
WETHYFAYASLVQSACSTCGPGREWTDLTARVVGARCGDRMPGCMKNTIISIEGEELPDPRAREERRVQIRALDGSEEMPSEKTLIEASKIRVAGVAGSRDGRRSCRRPSEATRTLEKIHQELEVCLGNLGKLKEEVKAKTMGAGAMVGRFFRHSMANLVGTSSHRAVRGVATAERLSMPTLTGFDGQLKSAASSGAPIGHTGEREWQQALLLRGDEWPPLATSAMPRSLLPVEKLLQMYQDFCLDDLIIPACFHSKIACFSRVARLQLISKALELVDEEVDFMAQELFVLYQDLLQLHRPDALEVSHELVKDKMAHFKGFKAVPAIHHVQDVPSLFHELMAAETLVAFLQTLQAAQEALLDQVPWMSCIRTGRRGSMLYR